MLAIPLGLVLVSQSLPSLPPSGPAPGAGAPAASAGHALPPGLRSLRLAGRPLAGPPWFTAVRAVNEGSPLTIAVDGRAAPWLAGREARAFVVPHRRIHDRPLDLVLADHGDGPETLVVRDGDVRANTFTIDAGALAGTSGTTELGIAYAIVLDLDGDGLLSSGDVVDGLAEPAFWAMPDLTLFGPHAHVEALYSGGSWLSQDLYYPADVASLGELPLVVVSHGNGHNYQWYDHVGSFLASWGYVVMSHSNDTGPGPHRASQTTLENTDWLLSNLDVVEGGVLLGHVDAQRIVWIGHSRGGEGVVRAYDRLVEGSFVPTSFGWESVRLISSMAPTDFLGPAGADPHGVAYHLWTGASDRDVTGCANCDICQTYHLHDRATGPRLSTTLSGVGHGDFHAGGGSSVATGPCLVGRADTHRVMRGYLRPLLAWALDGHLGAREYLWRSWEDLRPIGAPIDPCVAVGTTFQEAAGGGKLVIDDFQTSPELDRSSSGGRVFATVAGLAEGRLDDRNSTFTDDPGDPMNGMTYAGPGDDSRGAVVEWDGVDSGLVYELVPGARDLARFEHLSFRACQATRHLLTIAELGDVSFTVELIDRAGRSSALRIDAYGSGVLEPYQRGGCGQGHGWANAFETFRLPLRDFAARSPAFDPRDVVALAFLFGPSHGSPLGRIGLDEIELTLP